MQLKLVIAALLGLAVNASPKNASEMKLLFKTWQQVYEKSYTAVEEAKRFEIFADNYLKIVSHNSQNSSFKKGLNQFADLTSAEFKAKHATGLKKSTKNESSQKSAGHRKVSIPETVDWRQQGAVTPVIDEGDCGSNWAISAVGALEGINFIKTNTLTPLSVQQILDCDIQDQGCNGGWINQAFVYTSENGAESNEAYPYSGESGTCAYDASQVVFTNSGFENVQANDVNSLKTALVNQPVSAAIEADSLQFYTSGVVNSGCGAEIEAGVLIVGYDQSQGSDAFIVKNSWGSSWGVEGFVYISTDGTANNGAGVCGILTYPSFPTA